MPILNSLVRMTMKPLPRMISPRAHTIFDYIAACSMFASAAWLWPRSKRASVAALICAGTELGVGMLTDYPGGVRRVIHFVARREIDLGLAAMVATMPDFLGFDDEPEKKVFLAQGLAFTVLSELTDFPEEPESMERSRRGQGRLNSHFRSQAKRPREPRVEPRQKSPRPDRRGRLSLREHDRGILTGRCSSG